MITKTRVLIALICLAIICTACGNSSKNHKIESQQDADSNSAVEEIKPETESTDTIEDEKEIEDSEEQTHKKVLGYSMDYDISRVPIRYTFYEYDDNGNKTKEINCEKIDGEIYSYDAYYYENTYSDEGYLEKTIKTNAQDEKVQDEYTYDKYGNVIHLANTNGFGETYYSAYYEYDSSGCITGFSTVNSDGELEEYPVKKTDTGAIVYFIDEDGQEKIYYKYDHVGNRSICRQSGDEADGVAFYMDEYGNQVKIVNPNGNVYHKREYDDEGNMLSVYYYAEGIPDSAKITINHYFDLDQYLSNSELYKEEADEILRSNTPDTSLSTDYFDEMN